MLRQPRSLRLVTLCAVAVCMSLAACEIPLGSDDEPAVYEPVMGPQIPTNAAATLPLPAQAWMDRSLLLATYDETQLAEMASSPMVILPLRLSLSEEGATAIRRLRQLNPDLLVIGMFSVLSVDQSWNTANQRERFPIIGPIFDLMQPHRMTTTTGAEPLMWDGAPMVNPWTRGGFKESLLNRMMDVIAAQALLYPDILDGVFHDYMSAFPHLYPGQEDEPNVGEVDMDGDGIGTRDDPDENVAWVQWQHQLLAQWKLRFGPGLIQIVNGRLPHFDADIAGFTTGIAYESFPTTVWGYSDEEAMALLQEHLEPGWLGPARGNTFSLLWDRNGRRSTFCRIASMLLGQPYVLTDLNGFVGRDVLAPPASTPIGPMLVEDKPTGGKIFSREFVEGTARIETSSNGMTVRAEFTEAQ